MLGNIQGEKITAFEIGANRIECNVIGIHMVGTLPAQSSDGGIGFGPNAVGRSADDTVLAVGFIPNWSHVNTRSIGGGDCRELCFPLSGKTVAHSESVWFNLHNFFGLSC